MKYDWTKPFCGYQYLKNMGEPLRFSVSDHNTFAILTVFKKSGDETVSTKHDFPSVDAAKRKAERMLKAFDNAMKI